MTKREMAYTIIVKLYNFALSEKAIESEVDYLVRKKKSEIESLYQLAEKVR